MIKRPPWPGTPVGLAMFLLAVIAIFLAGNHFPYQIDDAYITYRYVVNSLLDQGMAFNAGEANVEGFSSPAWFYLLRLCASAIGSERLPAISASLGLLAYLATTGLIFAANYRLEQRLAAGFIAGLAFAVLPGASSYSVSGLETLAFCYCVVHLHAALLWRWSPLVSAVVAVLAIWLRPESPWLAVSLFTLVAARGFERGLLVYLCRLLAVFALAGVVLLGWRYYYFGELLANTYYAKPAAYADGLTYLRLALAQKYIAGLYVLGLIAAGISRESRALFLAALLWLPSVVLLGGDWMLDFRFMLPSLALCCLSLGPLARFIAVPANWRRATVAVTVGVLFLAQTVNAFQHARYAAWLSQRWFYVEGWEWGLFMRWFADSPARSIALVDIGRLGFASRQEIIDVVGLVDTHIAHSPGRHMAKQFDLAYLLEQRRPDVIVLRLEEFPRELVDSQEAVIESSRGYSVIEKRLLADSRLYDNYRLAFVMTPQNARVVPLYAFATFIRQDLDIPGPTANGNGFVVIKSQLVPPRPANMDWFRIY